MNVNLTKKNSRFKMPNIKKANTAHLWFETAKGKRWVPTVEDLKNGLSNQPNVTRYPYALSRFPTQIITTGYKRRKRDGGYGQKDCMFRAESGASGELAVRMVVRSNFTMPLDTALVICSTACERCMNILAHKHGLNWGYPPQDKRAKQCGTSCELCR